MTIAPKYYHLLVLGCQMNKNDAERLATILEKIGYQPTDDESQADLVGVVACAVRQSAMDRIHGKVRQWQLEKTKRPLITLLSGCVLQQDREQLNDKFDIFLDIKQLDTLPEQLKKLTDEQLIDLPSYFKIEPKYQSIFSAYVPIATGCNKFCTYCAVPYTRGKEISRPSSEIIEEVKNLIKRGYKEIILVGQNVNSYGLDLKDEIKFPALLQKLDKIQGDWWLRFMTSHPYDMSDDLIKELGRNKHLTNYLHLPMQSGDDQILEKMNRHYTIKHYKQLIEKIRKVRPTIGLSTDVIVGFCGETEEQFQKTLQLFKDVKFDMAYLSQYSTRPGTAAAKLYADDIPHAIKEKREFELNEVLGQTGLAYNRQFESQTVKVLVDSRRKKSDGWRYEGKTSESKTVTFNAPDLPLIGEFVNVHITKAKAFGLDGELVP
ncbi:MAG: tRNA (N6-isopentenyl adenosine(37)-C2)-methylthiotransferase MiaB [Candidatus Komeilibacteria bacterium]